MRRAAVVLFLLALGLAACQEKKSKAERYADSERHIVAKIEALKQKQQQIAAKIADLEQRLVAVRGKRDQLENRWAEPTPTVRAERPPS